jgi:hypothetical protein
VRGCAERFIDYVRVDTTADPAATRKPSSAGQQVLLQRLAEELRTMGLERAPCVGFIAHVDTSPEVSGAGVKPIVHRVRRPRPAVSRCPRPGPARRRAARSRRENQPHVVQLAERAIREAGLTPIRKPIRGGTDGAMLSHMGLPTPNLFSGQHNIHSRLEDEARLKPA